MIALSLQIYKLASFARLIDYLVGGAIILAAINAEVTPTGDRTLRADL